MVSYIRKHLIFLSITFAYIIFGLIIIILTEHGDTVLWMDKHHFWLSDMYFELCNLFGEGLLIALFVTAFVFNNWRQAIFIGIGLGLNSALTQALKHYFNEPRPKKYFWSIKETFHYVIPPEEVHTDFSFPSGHTNGAFTLFFCLAIIYYKNKMAQALLAIIAISTAISRIVLLQHFMRDTIAGAGIALIITTLVYFIVKQIPYLKEGLSG